MTKPVLNSVIAHDFSSKTIGLMGVDGNPDLAVKSRAPHSVIALRRLACGVGPRHGTVVIPRPQVSLLDASPGSNPTARCCFVRPRSYRLRNAPCRLRHEPMVVRSPISDGSSRDSSIIATGARRRNKPGRALLAGRLRPLWRRSRVADVDLQTFRVGRRGKLVRGC